MRIIIVFLLLMSSFAFATSDFELTYTGKRKVREAITRYIKSDLTNKCEKTRFISRVEFSSDYDFEIDYRGRFMVEVDVRFYCIGEYKAHRIDDCEVRYEGFSKRWEIESCRL